MKNLERLTPQSVKHLISDQEIISYVKSKIGIFHQKRIDSLQKLDLKKDLLRRKNPYLFKSKHLTISADLIRNLLDARLSSQEETLFGDFLEGLAIFVAKKVHGGSKSTATGIDLEFTYLDKKYIVSIKSGPNWGNSSQIKKMRDNFKNAALLMRQYDRTVNVVAINGCCYGRDNNPDKGDYFKYCGQEFWELISGDAELYKRIIEPLGSNAKTKNQEFVTQYSAVVNRFSQEFTKEFCMSGGLINWPKLVAFSSEKTHK